MEDHDQINKAAEMMREIASERTETALFEARTAVAQCHRRLLVETGILQLKQFKQESVDSAQKQALNNALSLVDTYLIGLECALQKIAFLRLMLDPEADTAYIQSQVEYQNVLEEILHVQKLQADKLLQRDPSLRAKVNCPNVYDGILQGFAQFCFLQPHQK